MHNTALPLISIKMMSWNKERKVWGKFDQEIFSIIYGFCTFTFTLICYFKFDFHFYLVFALSLSREEGLKRGFAALDAENTGRIPVDKFKRRLREVFEQRYCVFGVDIDICVLCVLYSDRSTSLFQSVRLSEAEAQQVVRISESFA